MAREKGFGLAEILAAVVALAILGAIVAGMVAVWGAPNLLIIWKVVLIILLFLSLLVLLTVVWERLKAKDREKFKEVNW